MDLDLNIDNYGLSDILKLYKLDYDFKPADVKNAYRMALKTHPDKSGLPPEYFHFFMKAYKIVEEINQFRNKNKMQKEYNKNPLNYQEMYVDNECETHRLHGDNNETNEKLLKNIKNKSKGEFNKWFNDAFDEVRIKDSEQDDGYEEWFRNNGGDAAENTVKKIPQNQFNQAFEVHREKARDLVKYRGIEETQSSNLTANSGYDILRKRPENYSSAVFSKLNYEDLKKAHTETIVPVSHEDFLNKKKFNSVNEMKQFRGKQNVTAISIEQSREYLSNQKNRENKSNTTRAYELYQQDKKMEETNQLWWSKIKALR